MTFDRDVLISIGASVVLLAVPLLGNACYFFTGPQCNGDNGTRLQSGDYEDNGTQPLFDGDTPTFPHRELSDRTMTIDGEERRVTVSYETNDGHEIRQTWEIAETTIIEGPGGFNEEHPFDTGMMGDGFSADGDDGLTD
jgi:hypothetical protein